MTNEFYDQVMAEFDIKDLEVEVDDVEIDEIEN